MTKNVTQPLSLGRIIRDACAQGRLLARTELLQILRERPTAPDAPVPSLEELEAEISGAREQDPDLVVVCGPDGEEFYRSADLMSATYAEILAGKSAPCLLMAETVRKNSREYPRPIALDMFEYPPFDLEPEIIQGCLRRMAEDADFCDVGFVESSAGTVYLFSSRYLERDHAAFLAERLDVDLALNP
ncbi:MAG: hypothetical protein LBH94_06485 [Deltaproteobacteria bacterium]|jgi:hypothetical protein|nr:hypothetical protein [Deltaproteobacteria bacterium]